MNDEAVKFKIDVLFNCNGEAQAADEAAQLQYINRLRLYVPVHFARIVDEYGGSYGPVLWPTMEEDLAAFTLLYDEIILAVYYDGSEVEMGVQYFHRGQFYFADAQIVYPKFEIAALPARPPRVKVVVFDGKFAGIFGLPAEYVVVPLTLNSESTDKFYLCKMDGKTTVLCSHHTGEQIRCEPSPISEIMYGPFPAGPCQLCPH